MEILSIRKRFETIRQFLKKNPVEARSATDAAASETGNSLPIPVRASRFREYTEKYKPRKGRKTPPNIIPQNEDTIKQ